jgi:pimeloyl-ACP methyl ester carboxylesterase
MAEVNVDGRNISFRIPEGPRKGHTVLMIHGATEYNGSWENQFRYLEKEHTPVTVNLPGRVGSEGPPVDNDADFREFIRAFGDALGIAPFVVCGHSMGGSISLDFALHYPDRLEGFIMVASSPSWEFGEEMVDLLRKDPREGAEVSANEFGDMFSKHTPEHIKQQVLALSKQVPVEAQAADLVACTTFHLEGDLQRINVPALVICGDEDGPSLPGSRLCAEKLPNARFQLVEQCGHPIMMEQPDVLNNAMDSFLKSLS